jgi:hypothetical protein
VGLKPKENAAGGVDRFGCGSVPFEPNEHREESMVDQNREDRIRQRAYALWEIEGKPHGADLRFWEQAMNEIDEADLRKDSSDTQQSAGAGPAIAKRLKDTKGQP